MESLIGQCNSEIFKAKSIFVNLEDYLKNLSSKQFDLQNQLENSQREFSTAKSEKINLIQIIEQQKKDIERITTQLELKENIINSQKTQMENLKSDYSQKFNQLENQKSSLQANLVLASAENDRLVKILFDKIAEFQDKIREFNQKQSVLEQDAKNQIENLKTNYLQDKQQIALQINNLIKEKEMLSKQKIDQDQQIAQLFEKNNVLEAENNEVVLQNNEKTKQLEIMQINLQKTQQDKQQQVETLQQQLNQEKKNELLLQEKQLKNTFDSEKSKLVQNEKSLKNKILDLENQNKYMTVEMSRIQQQSEELQQDLDQQKEKNLQDQDNFENERNQILYEFEQYKQAHSVSTDMETTFSAEKTSYETIIMQLKQKLSEQEIQIMQLKNENHKMNLLSQERMKQIEDYRNKFGNSTVAQEIDNLKNQIETQKQQLINQSEKNLKMTSEKNVMQAKLQALESELSHKEEELANQYDLINLMKQQAGGSYKQADDHRRDITSLKQQVTDYEGELLLKNGLYEDLKVKNEEYKNQIQSLQYQIQQNEEDIQKKSQSLIMKIKELDQIKSKYEDALNFNNSNNNINNNRISTQSSSYKPKYGSQSDFDQQYESLNSNYKQKQ